MGNTGAYLGLVEYAINRTDEPLLRARGYLVAGVLVQSIPDITTSLLDRTIKAVNSDEVEVVRVACIKSLQGFIKARTVPADRQTPIIASIAEFLESKDLTDLEDSDDLLVTLVDSLAAAIGIDPTVTIFGEGAALDLLFTLVRLSFGCELGRCDYLRLHSPYCYHSILQTSANLVRRDMALPTSN